MSTSYVFILMSMVAVGAGFLILVVFGLRNMSRGKHNKFSVGAVVVPFVIFGICIPLAGGEYSKAAILTVMVMAVIAVIGLVYSGVRGLTG